MAEWLKAHAWKACMRETVSWVRIPLPPPRTKYLRYMLFLSFEECEFLRTFRDFAAHLTTPPSAQRRICPTSKASVGGESHFQILVVRRKRFSDHTALTA